LNFDFDLLFVHIDSNFIIYAFIVRLIKTHKQT